MSIGGVLSLSLFGWMYFSSTKKPREGLKLAPEVRGGLPILGHFLHLVFNPTKFFDKCIKTYGKIFVVRIGLKKMVVITDRELGKGMINSAESNFSKEKVLYDEGIIDCILKPGSLAAIVPFMRHALIARPALFIQDVLETRVAHLQKFKSEIGTDKLVLLNDVITKVFTVPVLHTTIGHEPTSELLTAYTKLIQTGKTIQLVSHFLPQRLVLWLRHLVIEPLHDKVISQLLPIVQLYVNDKSKPSAVMRMGVDSVWKKLNNREFTPLELAESLLISYFAFEVNNPNLTLHVVKELSKRPDLCDRVREEAVDSMEGEALLQNAATLEAVIFESARINAAEMSIRKSCFPSSTLGEYDLGDCDCISIHGRVISPGEVSNPGHFLPERYLENWDANAQTSFWFWGGGIHACPGRSIAIKLTKVFVIQLLREFNLEFQSSKRNRLLDFDASLEENVWVKMTPRTTKQD